MFATGKAPADVVRELGLEQISGADELGGIVDGVIEKHAKPVADYRAGKQEALKFLVGQAMRETLAFGSPDTVARHIQHMKDLGVGHVLCWMNFGGLPQDKIRRSMELFATEVIPHFR